MATIKLVPHDILKTETDLIVISLFKDYIPLQGKAGYVDWMFNSKISDLIKRKKVFGIFKETVLLSTQHKIPADKMLLVGFGKASKLDSPKLLHLYSSLVEIAFRINIKNFGLAVDFPNARSLTEYRRISASMIEGLVRGIEKTDPRNNEGIVKVAEGDSTLFPELKKVAHTTLKRLNVTPDIQLEF